MFSTAQARDWAIQLKALAKPNTAASLLQLLITALSMGSLYTLMVFSLDYGYWITLLLALPAAGLVVRLFIIQHDCGHYSYFRSRRANDLLGRALGVITLTPHGFWRHTHTVHHATSGDLDRRGIGDISTLTVKEYRALPRFSKFSYRLYRNPIVMFGLGPTYLFVVKFRFPLDLLRNRWRSLPGIMTTNIVIALVVLVVGSLIGYAEFALVQIPITLIAATVGLWLFYVQHQFRSTSWDTNDDWDFHASALNGSSHYDLPGILRWFTGNIGAHHVHHLCCRVPNYRLRDCMKHIPELNDINRITLLDSLKCVSLALWDEDECRLVSFGSLK